MTMRLSRLGRAAEARAEALARREAGPYIALEPATLMDLAAEARRLRFLPGPVQPRLRKLAARHGIDLRTLYRYLRYHAPVLVRVGSWTALFAEKDAAEGSPVQLSGWRHDDEGPA